MASDERRHLPCASRPRDADRSDRFPPVSSVEPSPPILMPKKSDRSRHGSAMSQLLPDVSLEEDESRNEEEDSNEDKDSAHADAPAGEKSGTEPEDASASGESARRTTELQNSSDREQQRSTTREDKNYSSVEGRFSEESRKQGSEDQQPSAANRASNATSTPESERRTSAPSGLTVFPDNRPDLSQKLGPYVSADVDDALEDVYLLLRRRFGAKASKSLVVEVALRYILRDCLDQEEESELMRWFDRVLDP